MPNTTNDFKVLFNLIYPKEQNPTKNTLLTPDTIVALKWFCGLSFQDKIDCLNHYAKQCLPQIHDILYMFYDVFEALNDEDYDLEKNHFYQQCVANAEADFLIDSQSITLSQAPIWWCSLSASTRDYWRDSFNLTEEQCEIPEVEAFLHFHFVLLSIEYSTTSILVKK